MNEQNVQIHITQERRLFLLADSLTPAINTETLSPSSKGFFTHQKGACFITVSHLGCSISFHWTEKKKTLKEKKSWTWEWSMWVGEELLSSLLLLFTFAGVVFDPTGSSAFVLLFPYKILSYVLFEICFALLTLVVTS